MHLTAPLMDHRVILFLIFFPCLVITDKIFFRGTTLTRGVSYGSVQQHDSKKADMDHASETITEQWFEQRLDHFNPADTRTWKQVRDVTKRTAAYVARITNH